MVYYYLQRLIQIVFRFTVITHRNSVENVWDSGEDGIRLSFVNLMFCGNNTWYDTLRTQDKFSNHTFWEVEIVWIMQMMLIGNRA